MNGDELAARHRHHPARARRVGRRRLLRDPGRGRDRRRTRRPRRSRRPVRSIDVQTHLIDPARWHGEGAAALAGFLQHGRSRPMARRGRSAPARRRGVGGARVRRRARPRSRLLTSTPGGADHNVLLNPQIAATRELVDRYAGSGRVRTHAIVHPEPRRRRARRHGRRLRRAPAVGVEVLPVVRAADRRVADRWVVPRRRRDRVPVPRACRASGTRVVAVHKGLGRTDPVGVGGGGVAPRRRTGRRGVPRRELPRVPLGLRARSRRGGGRVRSRSRPPGSTGWSRAWPTRGSPPGANVYAELGSTWYLMLRRPVEAAHVLGKLLLAVGPDRIVWGTDSIWYGSPQPLIDAFRTFEIPERMQEAVRLSRAHDRDEGEDPGRERAVGLRHRRRRRRACVPPTRTRDWVDDAAPTIAAAITRVGRP